MTIFHFEREPIRPFYTLIDNSDFIGLEKIGTVFTESATHNAHNYKCLGRVTRRSPLGQGSYLGIQHIRLSVSTPQEVLDALALPHPRGPSWVPQLPEKMDIERQIAIAYLQIHASRCQPSWADRAVVSMRQRQIALSKVQEELNARWNDICMQQIDRISTLIQQHRPGIFNLQPTTISQEAIDERNRRTDVAAGGQRLPTGPLPP